MPSSLPESLEPEHAIEQSNLALCVISGQGELRYRDPPIVVKQKKGGCLVFVSFVALAEEVGPQCAAVTWELTFLQAFQIFVRNYGPYDASADLSASGESLGKWLVARGTKAWHNIASDTLFKFQESYDRQSKVFEPTSIEVQFRQLSKVEGLVRDHLVPVIVRQPSPEDGPGYVMQGDNVMQSKFEPVQGSPFLTFIILFYPPVPTTTFAPPPRPSITIPGPGSGSLVNLSTCRFGLVLLISSIGVVLR
ncbi:hypothetical protein BC826DRAFT_662960 [Russula brevipes]|nr:hypothetical protein BC826DRAFT_662960 [Russula brevipes]